MSRILIVALLCVSLAGCGRIGSSGLNPFNWFRSGEPEAEGLVPAAALARTETRPLVEEVTDLVVERVPGGALVRARGRTPATGWHTGALVREPGQSGGGILALSFRAEAPETPVAQAGPASRRLVAARYLSDQDLAGVGQIRVISRTNIRSARR